MTSSLPSTDSGHPPRWVGPLTGLAVALFVRLTASFLYVESWLGLAVVCIFLVGLLFYAVIWGGLHGVALIVNREWRERGFGSRLPALVGRLGGPLLTMWWVSLAWIFFRAEGLGDALRIVRAFVWFDAPGARELSPVLFLVFAGLAVVHGLNRLQRPAGWVQGLSPWAFWPAYGATLAVALAFVRPVVEPFIYFQF